MWTRLSLKNFKTVFLLSHLPKFIEVKGGVHVKIKIVALYSRQLKTEFWSK